MSDELHRLAKLIAELLDETPDRLVAAFGNGKISADELQKKLSAHFQSEYGGPIRGLAEYDKVAARQFGELLRNRLDLLLVELGAGDKPVAQTAQRQDGSLKFKDKTDEVLQREYVLIKALTGSNQELRSAEIIEAVKAVERNVADATITANLGRLVEAGFIGRERKGRYRGTAHSQAYLKDLKAEIEARGLALPGA